MRPTPRLRRKAHRKGWSREATHKRQCRNHNRGWNAAADMFPPPALVIIGGEGCTTVLPGATEKLRPDSCAPHRPRRQESLF
jgi:hypothetical protein